MCMLYVLFWKIIKIIVSGASVVILITAVINGHMTVVLRNRHGQIIYIINQFLCSPCKMLDGLQKNDNFPLLWSYDRNTAISP